MSRTPRRRRALMGAAAFVTAGALSILGVSVPANAAPGDNSQALAQFLGASLLQGSLATVGTADASSPSGPPSETNPLNVSALQALGLNLQVTSDGVTVPLVTPGAPTPGLLNLGSLGAVQNFASSSPTGSIAASGAVTNEGAIAIAENAAPGTGGNATVNFTSLLAQLGVSGATADIVDSLGLQVGATAARIETTAGGSTVATYRVADLKANLHSALVGRLATDLRTAGVNVGGGLSTSLNGLVGTGGAVTNAVSSLSNLNILGLASVQLGSPTIAVNVANLGTVVDTVLGSNAILVSDDGTVTINLTNGTVSVDLAKIVKPTPTGTGLNGLAPNTSVLTGPTLAAVTAGVTNALGKVLAPLTAGLQTAVSTSTVTISLRVQATALPLLGGLKLVDAPITISGTLAQIAAGTATVNTSGLALLPGVPPCLGGNVLGVCVGDVNGLVNSLLTIVTSTVLPTVLGALTPAVAGILSSTNTTITNTLNGVVNPVIGLLNPVLTNVLGNVATIVVNEQPAVGDLGPGSATVRALSITVLPNLGTSSLAKVSLGSATAAAVAAPTVDITETAVREGSTINVTGTGWDPASTVSVAYTDANGAPVGTADVVTPTAGGAIAASQLVPTGTAGPVRATATQGAFNGANAPSDTVIINGAPVFNVLESSAVPTAVVTATGANWNPALPVTLTYSNTADGELDEVEVDVADDGSFSTTYTVPEVEGPITVTATQGTDILNDSFDVVEPDAPFLNIIEPSVTAGQPVNLEGSFWAPDVAVSVIFADVNGDPIGSPVSVPVDGTGNFAPGTSFTLPYGTLGPVTATGTQTPSGFTASDSVNVVPAPVPTLTIDEDTVQVGGVIGVSGTNWLDGDVEIRVYNGATQVGVATTVVASGGTFDNDAFYLPNAAGPGTVTLIATQGPRTATDTIEVTAVVIPPTFDIVQTQVTAGKQITLNGTGWNSSLIVGITFATPGPTPAGGTMTGVDPDGTFSIQYTVPANTAIGDLTGTASDSVSTLADVVQVLAAPTVNIQETAVAPGGTINIDGGNWATDTGVTLTVSDANGQLTTFDTSPSGAGTIAATYVLPPGAVGPITVTASQTTPALGTNTASDTVAIAAPPVPDIDIVEPTVEAGQPINIDGTGWSAASLVTIAFSDANGPLPGTVQVFPLTDGSFEAQYTVPVTTVGPLTASATQNGGAPVTDTVAVTPVPTTNIVENEIREGDSLNITGDNWAPTSTVSITFTDGNNVVIGVPITPPTDGDGHFETTWPVPTGTVGPVTATVSQGTDTATDSVGIREAPSVNIVEDEVSEGQSITITGLDWDPAAQVTLAFEDGNGDPITGTQQVSTLGNGAFTSTFVVPLGTVGPVTVMASQNGETPIEDDVIVNVRTVVIAEDEVAEGDDITIGGDNWTPNGTVTISFTDGDGEPIDGPITAPINGTGHFDATWPVPTGTVGPITVSVVEDVTDPPVTDSVDVTPTAVDADADVAVDADADVDVDGVDADLVDADAVDADADLVDADADLVDADADLVDADADLVDADVVDADADLVDADADLVDADADLVDADVDAVDADLVDADADLVDADVVDADADLVDADVVDADVDAAADAVDVDADVVDADADTDVLDADADLVDADVDAAADAVDVDADVIDADVDTDVLDADADVVDADVDAAADAVDVDADVVDADADVDVLDVDADVVDADVDAAADAVDVDADAVDVDADTDVMDADADLVDADVADADVDAAADAVDVDADVIDADVDAAADAVDVDAAADAVDVDADAAADADVADADVDADAADADAAADADVADADADGTPLPTVLPRATVEHPSIVRGTGVTQKFFGYGFQPGETVSATVFSTPIALTPQVADASGNVVFSILIGANFELGAHRVEFEGSVSGALPTDRETTSFVVTGNPAVLASTGFTGMWLAGLAALLMLAGAGGLGFARTPRRRVN